jgi:FkbM family methyltransferase
MKLSRLLKAAHRVAQCVEGLGWGAALKVQVQARLLKRRTTVPIRGHGVNFTLRSGKADLSGLEVFYSGWFPWVAGVPVRSVLDGGANNGDSALYLWLAYKPEVLVAVEPAEDNYELLCTNTQAIPAIRPVRGAVWHEDTTLRLDLSGGSTVSNTVSAQGETGVAVVAKSIATLAREQGLEGFDLVKLDIEGAERELLLEERATWLKTCKIFLLELHDHIAPGAADALFAAVHRYGPFRMLPWGEYLVFVRTADAANFKIYGTLKPRE